MNQKHLSFALGVMVAVGLETGALGAAADPVRPANANSADATATVQAALDVGGEIVLSREGSPWNVGPLFVRSNTRLVLEPGAELVARSNAFFDVRDRLLTVAHAANVTVSGGAGSAIRMRREDYCKPPYAPSEWRHAVYVSDSTNVVVEGLLLTDSGGDGLCAGGKTKGLTVRDCDSNRNHRQGISICTGEDILIERCRLRNTRGTAPEAGVDFEPNQGSDCLVNCVMRDCAIENNYSKAIEVNLTRLRKASRPVSLTFENCRTVGAASSCRVLCGGRADDFVGGFVRFVNCSFASPRDRVFWFGKCPGTDFTVTFESCTVSGVPRGPNLAWFESGVLDEPPPDGIDFGKMTVKGPVDEPWSCYRNPGVAPAASHIAGEMVFENLAGRPRTVTLDAAWAAANLPPVNGGRPLPARQALPKKPLAGWSGSEKPLAPVVFGGRALGIPIIFHSPRAGEVRLSVRRVGPKKKTAEKAYAMYWLGADGRRHGKRTYPVAAEGSQEIVFAMPRSGYCLFETPWRGGQFVLEKSSVEPAFDVRSGALKLSPERGRTIELGFDRIPGSAMLFVAPVHPCDIEVIDGTGVPVLVQTAAGRTLLTLPEGSGRWCVRVTGKGAVPAAGFDLYGTTPLFYIPSSEGGVSR